MVATADGERPSFIALASYLRAAGAMAWPAGASPLAVPAIDRTDKPRPYTTEVASRQSDRHPLLDRFPVVRARIARPITQKDSGAFDLNGDTPGRVSAICPGPWKLLPRIQPTFAMPLAHVNR